MTDPDPDRPLLEVRGLRVTRPGGAPLFEGLELRVRPGEVVALLGSSGAGKSTLLGALHDREGLIGRGFGVTFDALETRAPIGIVPQRGALFDHLSVAGNLELALRNAEAPVAASERGAVIERWLGQLDLPPEWREPGHGVAHVSGGEAQRLAVARTLAGGRRILFLDEPSVGLDPLRVRRLAAILRRELREDNAAALVITHDLHFAAAFADRFLYMDQERRALVELEVGANAELTEGTGKDAIEAAARDPEVLRALETSLSALLVDRLERERLAPRSRRPRGLRDRLQDAAGRWAAPFAVASRGAARGWGGLIRGRADVPEVARVVMKQGLLRPAPFFAIVSTLIGFTILYIFHRSLLGGGMPVRPDRVFGLIGSMHIIALAPPLAGILFAATSASAITAWLGGMSLTNQTTALRALGIEEPRYLWVPTWVGLVISFVVLAGVFTAGMVLGGTLYLDLRVPGLADGGAFELVTADLVDPPPGRVMFRTRAAVLMVIYALGIASDAVAKGAREKTSAEAVTVAMVRSVMSCTLWIVAIELLSLVVLYAAR